MSEPMAGDLQEAYDAGFEDGAKVGREMEREAIAKRLAADVGGRVEPAKGIVVRYPRQLGHTSWAEVKAKREAREMGTRTYADAAGFIVHVPAESPVADDELPPTGDEERY